MGNLQWEAGVTRENGDWVNQGGPRPGPCTLKITVRNLMSKAQVGNKHDDLGGPHVDTKLVSIWFFEMHGFRRCVSKHVFFAMWKGSMHACANPMSSKHW